MSFYFSIEANQDLTYDDFLQALSHQDATFAYADAVDLAKNMKGSAQLYLPQQSTRGVSIRREKTYYEVGINVGAAPQDLELALSSVCTLSDLNQGNITPEDQDDPLSLADFQTQYLKTWQTQFYTHGIGVIRRMVEDENEILTLHGCLLPFHIGPGFIQHLIKDQPDEITFAERLWTAMRRVQFLTLEEPYIRVPGRYQVEPNEGDQWTYTVLVHGTQQALLKTTHTILALEEARVKVTLEQLQHHAEAEGWERLDEEQYLLPPLDETNFKALMQALEEATLGGPASDV